MNNPFRSVLFLDVFIVLSILIAGLKFTYGLDTALDIAMADESFDLYRGVTIPRLGLPGASDGPLYNAWYYILSLAETDRVTLYYLNRKMMVILPALAAYAALRAHRVSMIPSLLISLWFLTCRENVEAITTVSHFALILLLLTLTLVAYTDSLFSASLLGSLGALLVSYVRPEYFVAYLLCVALLLVAFIHMRRRGSPLIVGRRLTALVATGVMSLSALTVIGVPLAGGRSLNAFGQHFSLNWASWTNSDLYPWGNWESIVAQNFGAVHSVPAAFARNPALFLKHLTSNLLASVTSVASLGRPTMIPPGLIPLVGGMALLLLGVLIITAMGKIRRNVSSHKPFFAVACAFLLPGLISVIVIYPRGHYLLPLCMLALMIVAVLLSGAPRAVKVPSTQAASLLILSVLLVAIVPCYAEVSPKKQANVNTIRLIQSLRITEPVNIFAVEGLFNYYVGNNFHLVPDYTTSTRFDQFLAQEKIGMIIVSDLLLQVTRFKNDAEWRGFLTNYSEHGWTKVEIPGTSRLLVVDTTLLSEQKGR